MASQFNIAKETISGASAAILGVTGTIFIALLQVDIRGFVGGDVRTPAFASLNNSKRVVRLALGLTKTVGLVDTRVRIITRAGIHRRTVHHRCGSRCLVCQQGNQREGEIELHDASVVHNSQGVE